jgi:hypothetical protein
LRAPSGIGECSIRRWNKTNEVDKIGVGFVSEMKAMVDSAEDVFKDTLCSIIVTRGSMFFVLNQERRVNAEVGVGNIYQP